MATSDKKKIIEARKAADRKAANRIMGGSATKKAPKKKK